MPRVGLIYHDSFLEHDTGHQHPENHARLEHLYAHLRSPEFDGLFDWVEAKTAQRDHLLLNHSSVYIDYVEKACSERSALLDDGDTRVCDRSFDAALHGVGAAMQSVDLLHRGEYDRLFAAVRPPGHHAVEKHAMGFCLFNNVAIAAKYAMAAYGYQKVMILDWDVHHGNGTQDSFYEDDRVLFCSIHQSPLFPGGGHESETGEGNGEFHTINIPLAAGSEVEHYRYAIKNKIIPAALAFAPDLLILSAGFDAHQMDPLANMSLRDEDFYELTELSLEIAKTHCDGKIISFLEGGYHHDALCRSVGQHLLALNKSQIPVEA